MPAALIDLATGAVLNVIVADATKHQALPGTRLVNVPADLPVTTDWLWQSKTGFIAPKFYIKTDASGNVTEVIRARADKPAPQGAIATKNEMEALTAKRYTPEKGIEANKLEN